MSDDMFLTVEANVEKDPDHIIKINGYSYDTVTMALSVDGEITYCKYKEQAKELQARIDELEETIENQKPFLVKAPQDIIDRYRNDPELTALTAIDSDPLEGEA